MSESDRKEIRRQAEMAGVEKLQVVLNFFISRGRRPQVFNLSASGAGNHTDQALHIGRVPVL